MSEKETISQTSARGLGALEAGQVVEIRVGGVAGSYWSYIKDVADGLTVWLPELSGAVVRIAAGTAVELSVTLSDAEILVVAGKVKGPETRDNAFVGLELDAATVLLEHRRRFLRVSAVVPASLRRLPDGVTPWGDAVKARTLNLSPGGLTLESEGAFTQGEQMAVELELPDCLVKATALVLESSGAGEGLSRLAVRFTCISDAAEAGITRLMFQYQRAHGAARA